jgi:hemerythrin superfamily protein
MPNATDLLRQDHTKVKNLFREFEDTDDAKRRKEIAEEVFMELDIHAQIEEEIFYPAIRSQEDPVGDMEETMNEADEEHHIAKVIMKELKSMRSVDGKYAAKFTVLAENVKHHIGEEEAEIFTKAAEKGSQYLQDLGAEMEARKAELMVTYSKAAAGRKSTAADSSGRKRTTRTRTGTATKPVRKGAGSARARTKTTARKTKTAARKTKTAAKKTARSAATTTRAATRSAKSAVRKTARKASTTAKKATRR